MAKKEKQEQLPFSLRSVYWREGKQWMTEEFDPLLPGQQLVAQVRSTPGQIQIRESVENAPGAKPVKSCVITTNFQFRYLNANLQKPGQDEQDSKSLVAEISACIAIDYLIETPEMPPKETLKQWALSASLLHSWPYWREFCHSSLLRMNLPVTMIPMMVIENNKD